MCCCGIWRDEIWVDHRFAKHPESGFAHWHRQRMLGESHDWCRARRCDGLKSSSKRCSSLGSPSCSASCSGNESRHLAFSAGFGLWQLEFRYDYHTEIIYFLGRISQCFQNHQLNWKGWWSSKPGRIPQWLQLPGYHHWYSIPDVQVDVSYIHLLFEILLSRLGTMLAQMAVSLGWWYFDSGRIMDFPNCS